MTTSHRGGAYILVFLSLCVILSAPWNEGKVERRRREKKKKKKDRKEKEKKRTNDERAALFDFI